MPMNNYNIGKDVTIQIFGYDGAIKSFSMRTKFTSRQAVNAIKVKRFDGNIDHLFIPDGWEGSFDYTRRSSELDDYFASLENDYYNGVDIQPGQITETITEVGQNISQYRYTGVMWKLDDAGDKTGDNIVAQRLGWASSRRYKV